MLHVVYFAQKMNIRQLYVKVCDYIYNFKYNIADSRDYNFYYMKKVNSVYYDAYL